MNIRIQTYGNFDRIWISRSPRFADRDADTTTATAALAKGLKDLEDLCDVVEEKFLTARDEFVMAQ